MNGYKSPSGTTDNNDGGVNNLSALSSRRSALSQNRHFVILSALSQSAVGFKQSAIGFKSKSAFSMRLLMTLFKDSKKE